MGKKNRKPREKAANVPRDPPAAVKQILRQEVHYACPIPGCGRPFLEWHHFDPKWEEKHHHNPIGMIALCTLCHPKADRGTWTKDELRSFKKNPAPLGLIRETFGWSERSVIYRLGGCFAADCRAGVIAIRGRPVLWEERSPEGRLLFSLDFRDSRGQPLFDIRQNFLSIDSSRIWDLSLNTGATFLKVWLGARKPGIELGFRRLSLEQLLEIMNRDRQRARPVANKLLDELVGGQRGPDAGCSSEQMANLPDASTTLFFHYVAQHCRDTDGNITLVDITRGRLFGPGGALVEISELGLCMAGAARLFVSNSFDSGGFAFSVL